MSLFQVYEKSSILPVPVIHRSRRGYEHLCISRERISLDEARYTIGQFSDHPETSSNKLRKELSFLAFVFDCSCKFCHQYRDVCASGEA